MNRKDLSEAARYFQKFLTTEGNKSEIKNIEKCLQPIYTLLQEKEPEESPVHLKIYKPTIQENSKNGYCYSWLKRH